MYYFDNKLIKLLNLDYNTKYSCQYISNIIKTRSKLSLYSKKNKRLWKLDKHFLNLLMEFKLVGTNKSFYELFYLSGFEWRNHYKIGFSSNMIIQMIKSIIVDKLVINTFVYKDTGKKIDNIII